MKKPKNNVLYFLGLGGLILILMYYTVSSNGHSFETTYDLGVPQVMTLSLYDPITGEQISGTTSPNTGYSSGVPIEQIKCWLKQTTEVNYFGGKSADILQSPFSKTMNPFLAFYSVDDSERDNKVVSYTVTPKIRCLNMALPEDDQRKDQFEIKPSGLTLKYYGTDNNRNPSLLYSLKDIKTGSGVISYQWDKTSGNYVKLEYGTETELMTFKIPMIKVIDKLPEGEYESKQTFGVSGVLQLNWQHPEDKYRNQSFYLPVTFDDIKTDVIIKVDTDDDTTIPPPPPPPTTPPPEPVRDEDDDGLPTLTWLEELINNISDCADRPTLQESAFCMIQIQAVYFVGLGIIAIGIAGQIFNRRRGYHDY